MSRNIFIPFLLLTIIVAVAVYTNYRVKHGWSGDKSLSEGFADLYGGVTVGGIGWGDAWGEWQGDSTGKDWAAEGGTPPPNACTAATPGNDNVLTCSTPESAEQPAKWNAPGWSVLFKGAEVGGVGVDQVFHKTSVEGELGFNLDSPSAQDTIKRLGGGYSSSWVDNKNSLVAPRGPTAPADDSFGKINGDLTFYAPGAYMYGADNYVPSYTESILLSPMLGVNAPLKPVYGEGQGTFTQAWQQSNSDQVCNPNSGASVLDKEAYCQKLSVDDAANKSCCVVLGNRFPMAGNDQGPFNRAVYTDPAIPRESSDFYIHQNKCYGNCG
jgi:hypothetical protein